MLNMETFMQQAVQAFRQLEANPPCSGAAPQAHPPQPQPEGLSTASQQPSVPPASAAPASSAPNPSVKRLIIRSVVPASSFPVSGPPNPNSQPPHREAPTQGLGNAKNPGLANPHSRLENGGLPEAPNPIAYAHLDSGATHAMRQALDEEEWDLRELYEAGEVILVYCPGAEQAADLLTKALPSARILELAAIWGLLEHGTVRPAEAETGSQAQTAGAGTLTQQDLLLSTVAVLLALFQVVGAASQSTDEEEDLSLPVPLDADLMLAVSIICIGICFIAVWEFFKWCCQGVISRREAGTAVSSLSPRKARKLQRLRDQTAQAIQAEISAREELAVGSCRSQTPPLTNNSRRA